MISTGLAGLDKLLGGGIAPSIITDIFGPAGSGKTQLAMQICANAVSVGQVVYQDTTGSFRPERMFQMLKARGIDQKLLANVIVARATNTAEQMSYLNKIPWERPVLVVIDSVSDLFSFEYSKESRTLEKHIRFMEYMHSLSLLAIQRRIPVIVTNVVRQRDDEETENLDRSISIFTHKKIRLSRDGNKFLAQVMPSFGKTKELLYKITPEGLVETLT